MSDNDMQGRPASELGDEELEREYVRRHPKRTRHGSGGAPADLAATAEAWRETVRGVIQQLKAHQAAREVGLERAAVDKVYNTDPPLLAAELQDRVITDVGRARLAGGLA